MNSKIQVSIKLPTHSQIKIQFKLFKIDNWDNNKATLKVDNQENWNQIYTPYQDYSICRDQNYEYVDNVELNLFHSKEILILELSWNLNGTPDKKSIGLRDVQVFIDKRAFLSYDYDCCGDQIKQYSEDCDDGNTIPFDGCFNCKYSCIDGCLNCVNGFCLLCNRCNKSRVSHFIIINKIHFLVIKNVKFVLIKFVVQNVQLDHNWLQVNVKVLNVKMDLFLIMIIVLLYVVMVKSIHSMKNVMMEMIYNMMDVIIVYLNVNKIVRIVKKVNVSINVNMDIKLIIINVQLYVVMKQLEVQKNVMMEIMMNLMDVINININTHYIVMNVLMVNVKNVKQILFQLIIFVLIFVVMEYQCYIQQICI